MITVVASAQYTQPEIDLAMGENNHVALFIAPSGGC
jgi:hypothetical protein